MKITVITVGKIKEKFFADAVKEYAKRLSKYCKLEILEAADESTPDKSSPAMEDQIRKKEAERILHLMKKDSYIITLEIQGKKFTSTDFADQLENLGLSGNSHLTFIIGGSLGLHHTVTDLSSLKISFSDMTFPHQLMRVILLEQIYRAYRIISHEPYHK